MFAYCLYVFGGGQRTTFGSRFSLPTMDGGLTHVVRPGQHPFCLLSHLLNPGPQVFVSSLFLFLHEEKFGEPVSR